MRETGSTAIATIGNRPKIVPWWIALSVTIVLATLIIWLGTSAWAADPVFPELTGRVVDNANLLSSAEEAQLTSDLADLEIKSTDQLVVVTLPSLQGFEIEEFGYRLGRHWGIGQAGKDNGVLLIIAPNERKVRIEVGRGLEPTMTDALSRIVIENAILPRFRRGDFPGGIVAGAKDITDILLGNAEEVEKRARGANRRSNEDVEALIFLLIFLAIVIFIVWKQHQQAKKAPRQAGQNSKRRRSGPDWVIVPGPGSGGRGNWGGGGFGGGFGGGGGGFGGGGASGGW